MATLQVWRAIALILVVQGSAWRGGNALQVNESATEPVSAEPVMEPQTEPVDDDIQYHLYTRAHPTSYILLRNGSLEESDFNTSCPTVLVIHGFTGSGTTTSVTLIRDAFLVTEDVNLVAVHWERLASGPDYEDAANNTAVVAAHVASTIERLISQGVRLGSLHLVGFSLGAQVAGLAGGLLSIGKLPRITALDPARPKFENKSDAERLDVSDAEFVLVLHTSGGFVSFEEPLGHADFYPNGGKSPQPACTAQLVKLVCSHLIAPLYFVESIYQPTAFPASRCQSWADFDAGLCRGSEQSFLGPHTPPSTRGQFFLRTNAQEPYGRSTVVDLAGNAVEEDASDGDGSDRRAGRKVEPSPAVELPVVVARSSSGPEPAVALLAAGILLARRW